MDPWADKALSNIASRPAIAPPYDRPPGIINHMPGDMHVSWFKTEGESSGGTVSAHPVDDYTGSNEDTEITVSIKINSAIADNAVICAMMSDDGSLLMIHPLSLLPSNAGAKKYMGVYMSSDNDETTAGVDVTGEIVPNVAVSFSPSGAHNGQTYYQATVGSDTWYLAWDGVNTWWLSKNKGATGDPGWKRVDEGPLGVYYVIGGTETGNPIIVSSAVDNPLLWIVDYLRFT